MSVAIDRALTPQCSTTQPRPSCGPVVEVEEPAEPRVPPHATPPIDDRRSLDESIAEALVIPFAVVVRNVLRHRASEVPFADRNQPVEAFFRDRSHEALRIGVRI